MKLLAALVLVILFTSCSEFDQTIEYRIAPEVAEYVESFYREAEIRGVHINKSNLIVRLQEEPNKQVNPFIPGISFRKSFQRIIVLDQWTIENMSHEFIEIVVFHELGHSLLDLGHNDGLIMSITVDPSIYEDHSRDELLDELFKAQSTK